MAKTYQTRQLAALLACIRSHHDGYVTVKGLMEQLDEAGSSMGLATIYRQMEKLEAQGLVHRVASDERSGACWKYCGSDHAGACILVKCEQCGTITHMDCDELPGLYRHLAEHHGFTVNPNRTLLYGTCAACAGIEVEGGHHGTDHLH